MWWLLVQAFRVRVMMSETYFQMAQQRHHTWNTETVRSRDEESRLQFSYRMEYILRTHLGWVLTFVPGSGDEECLMV